jgi:hypothetical protein
MLKANTGHSVAACAFLIVWPRNRTGSIAAIRIFAQQAAFEVDEPPPFAAPYDGKTS